MIQLPQLKNQVVKDTVPTNEKKRVDSLVFS